MIHEPFLRAALSQAWLGRGFCAPNPSVGAVAVQNGKIIAQAWHRGAGTAHAEQLLLQQLPPNSTDITLYVTLEPCNHWGRTPPCVDAIISYGIKKVIYAYSDPNPVIAANNTPKLLQEKGIAVEHVPLSEIDSFYNSYAYWISHHLPFVTVKIAQTLDGKIAGPKGERLLLSNEACAQFTHMKRKQSDIILTTARTINQDNPMFNARLSGESISKPMAIIDAFGDINPEAHIFSTAKMCHVFHAEQSPPARTHDKVLYHSVPCLDKRLDLVHVIKELGRLGFHDVWVEAGGELFSALHRAKLVNRTYIYIVPTYLGQNATSAYPLIESLDSSCAINWHPMEDNMILSLDWSSDWVTS